MCGIAGIVSPRSIQDQTLSALLKALRHRGPDDEGTYLSPDRNVGLAHTRLSILDLSGAGHQPMEDPENRWIVYNGEIYNYRQLRAELAAPPGGWKSNGDTEVILRSYAQWGLEGLGRFRGMFAFGLWDAPQKRLILARDPLGIKPLYYALTQDRLIFASEVRSLLESGCVSRQINPQGLLSYFSFGSVETPLTPFKEIRSLSPGEVLIAHLDGEKIRVSFRPLTDSLKNWAISSSSQIRNREQTHCRLREVLEESVRVHLVSDVPVGAFLSGGIDSSAVVALMSRVGREKPHTFSVVFREQRFSEAAYARMISERYGTIHREILLSEEDLLLMLPEALTAMDLPTMDGINTYVVSKAVREAGITVALSGLGADELFGGYPSFSAARAAHWLKLLPRSLRRILARTAMGASAGSSRREKCLDLLESDGGPWAAYSICRRLFSPKEISLLSPSLGAAAPLFPGISPFSVPSRTLQEADPFSSASLYEIQHYMVNTLLRDTDSMSMAHALEVRVPYIDHEVIRTVLAIPSKYKVGGHWPKSLLLDAMGEDLPEEIWRRPKQGFTLPFERWMRSRLRNEIETVLKDEAPLRSLGLQPESVWRLWENFLRFPGRVGWSRPWALYVLVQWSRLHGVHL